MSQGFFRVLLGLAIFLAACQPAVFQNALPPPPVWRVQITSELDWLGKAFSSCTSQPAFAGKAAILVDEPGREPVDFSFRWNPENSVLGKYTAVLGQIDLALIVNPANKLTQIELSGLQAIFSGKAADWSQVCKDCANAGRIQPLVYPEGNDTGAAFDAAFPGFNSRPADAVVAPDPQAVHAQVAANLQSIGFVPSTYLDSAVRQVKINGIEPGQLRFPLVVSSASEPTGLKLAWLLCVQDTLK
jgi:hypothetical protein